MLGLDAKRGVEATLERVYNATGNTFSRLEVVWSGKTAGVMKDAHSGVVSVTFPGIDETKQVDKNLFNQLIGYALHELGHVWFTVDKPWQEAREQHGAFVSSLINGLEDPRIEKCVVDSGYAPNARQLFEHLTNQVLERDGYVEPDDFKNIPFLLAIEGRRLNGYDLVFPSVVEASPYASHLKKALKAAHKAESTKRIVEIAVELYAALKQQQKEQQKQEQQQGEGGDQPQASQEQPDDNQTNPAEEGGRDVEPDRHIEQELDGIGSSADRITPRPHPAAPVYEEIHFI
jgi:hypothetical protein